MYEVSVIHYDVYICITYFPTSKVLISRVIKHNHTNVYMFFILHHALYSCLIWFYVYSNEKFQTI